MVIEVKLPQFGMGMQDATVISWYCKVGDRVKIDDALLEIESAKTTVEVPSPASGVLTRILVQPGENVQVLAVLAEISEDGNAAGQIDSVGSTAAAEFAPPMAVVAAQPRATPLATSIASAHGLSLAQVPASGHGGRVNAADVRGALASAAGPGAQLKATPVAVQVEPRARKRAMDAGLALEGLAGSGPDGRVVEQDVLKALALRSAEDALRSAATAAPAPAQSPVPAPASSRIQAASETSPPRRGMRDIIASRMMQSLHGSAQLTLTSEVDVTALVRLRNYLKGDFEVGYTCLFVKACALALQRHPQMNASWTDAGVRRHAEVNIGVAVALDDGLLVPVIRDVPAKNLRMVADDFAKAVQRARTGAAGSGDLSGGTFSVSSLGNWGIDAFTPVLNTPEAGILGLGRITDRLVKEGDGMAWRKVMVLSLTFDHRVVDGAPAAQFLQQLARIVAQPEALLA